MKKYLIIHADDLGITETTNIATLNALKSRWVTSASIMAPCKYFNQAIEMIDFNIDIGVHITLNSEMNSIRWKSLSNLSSLHDEEGFMHKTLDDLVVKANDIEIQAEIETQIIKCLESGKKFSHIDSHMGAVALKVSWLENYRQLAKKYSLIPMMPKWTISLKKYLIYKGLPWKEVKEYLDSLKDIKINLITDEPGEISYVERKKRILQNMVNLPHGINQIITHLDNSDWDRRRKENLEILSSREVEKILNENDIVLTSWSKIGSEIRLS